MRNVLSRLIPGILGLLLLAAAPPSRAHGQSEVQSQGEAQAGTGSGAQPPAQAGPTGAPADGGRPVRAGWLTDRMPLTVGDVVTILVDEYTLASSDLNELRSQDRDRDLNLAGGSGATLSGGTLRTRNDVANRNRGGSSRTDRFQSEISVRVVERSPTGMLRVEGRRVFQIDKVEQEVIVSGWLRPQDVSVENTIESWRLAEPEIRYASNGKLAKAGGFWSSLFNLIVP